MWPRVLTRVFSRFSRSAGAFAFLDLPSCIEVLALASFSCCLLGNLAESFPLSENLALALLALLATRTRSEVQLLALCGFCLFTIITDVVFMCTEAGGWGGAMTLLNILLKLAMASGAQKLCYALEALSEDMGGMMAGGRSACTGLGAGAYPSASYAAPSEPPPLGPAVDESLGYEEASGGGGAAISSGEVGVTRYRAI